MARPKASHRSDFGDRTTVLIAASLSLALIRPAAAQTDGWRTIELAADVAVSPDGQWLVHAVSGWEAI
ncbi:MAG: hypothetical protein IID06_09145 [Gemmatimonadetes bacterium]|nr:hypothetical protein [Gemmatimonadota bacterium]